MFAALALAAALAPMSPDPTLTPGDVNPAATLEVICVPGYTAKPGVRHVSAETKAQVYKEYSYDRKAWGPAEVDHLISLELGGSNDIKNLWPQAYTTTPYNAHLKDALEDRLHSMVCKNEITLKDAQYQISHDWIGAYSHYVVEAQ